MKEGNGEVMDHVTQSERNIRRDTTEILTQAKIQSRDSKRLDRELQKMNEQLENQTQLLESFGLKLGSKDQSSHSRPFSMHSIITEDSSLSSSSFASASTSFSNNRLDKPPTVPNVSQHIQSILDDDTVESTPEKNRTTKIIKEQNAEIAQLKAELKERDQQLKSTKDSLASVTATRNILDVKPTHQKQSKREKNAIATHVQQTKEGRINKRKNESALNKRLPPASRDR